MSMYCMETLGNRNKYQEARLYDTDTFDTIKNLMGDFKEDKVCMIDLNELDFEHYTKEEYCELKDGIAFFIAAGLLKQISNQSYIVDMDKFNELSELYISHQTNLNIGVSKTIGTIK